MLYTAQEPANTNLQVREDTVKQIKTPHLILLRARCRQRSFGEDMNRGVYVERLSEVTVGSLTEAFQARPRGSRRCARSVIEQPSGTLARVAATASRRADPGVGSPQTVQRLPCHAPARLYSYERAQLKISCSGAPDTCWLPESERAETSGVHAVCRGRSSCLLWAMACLLLYAALFHAATC